MTRQKTLESNATRMKLGTIGAAVFAAALPLLSTGCAHEQKQATATAVASTAVNRISSPTKAEIKRMAEKMGLTECDPGSICNPAKANRQWVTTGSRLATKDYEITVMGLTEYGVILLAENPGHRLMFQALFGQDFLDAPEIGIFRVDKGGLPNTASLQIK
jgi:hypothetical protein